MNVFELVKNRVSNRDAAEVYGVDVNRHGFAHCPFHADHTPSLYVADDHYHCYGCGAHGDVIDFTAKLFGISLHRAAKQLAQDFGLDPNLPPANILQFPVSATVEDRRVERACIHALQEEVDRLERWYQHHAPKKPGDNCNPRFVEACQKLNTARYYLDTLLIGSPVERKQVVDMLMADRSHLRKEVA